MQLVRRHHEEQRLIARNVVAALAPTWLILDPRNIPGTTAPWLKATRPIVERGFLTSQYVAAEFVKSYRSAELPDAEPLDITFPNPLGTITEPVIPDRSVPIRILVSLKVTGPVWLQNRITEDTDDQRIAEISRLGLSKLSGAATRLVLNGGRGVVRMMVGADPLARGIAGVASDGSCKSCKFLTNPIMKSDGRKKMDAVAVGHDFCTCSAKPIY